MSQLMLVSRPIWLIQRMDRRRGRSRASKAEWEIEDSGFKPAESQRFSAAVRPTEVALVA